MDPPTRNFLTTDSVGDTSCMCQSWHTLHAWWLLGEWLKLTGSIILLLLSFLGRHTIRASHMSSYLQLIYQVKSTVEILKPHFQTRDAEFPAKSTQLNYFCTVIRQAKRLNGTVRAKRTSWIEWRPETLFRHMPRRKVACACMVCYNRGIESMSPLHWSTWNFLLLIKSVRASPEPWHQCMQAAQQVGEIFGLRLFAVFKFLCTRFSELSVTFGRYLVFLMKLSRWGLIN